MNNQSPEKNNIHIPFIIGPFILFMQNFWRNYSTLKANRRDRTNRLVLLLGILVISGITHLVNPVGFPDLFYDEGVYIGRALHFLNSGSAQDGDFHGHPWFGQVFLGTLFALSGFPESLADSQNSGSDKGGHSDSQSPEAIRDLYFVPRVWMGILSIVDTFLIYKICDIRYGHRAATLAAILFALMPVTWFTRRVLLDSILLPFFLSSLFFALYSIKIKHENKRMHILVLLSGIFLGVTIFTKASLLVMIPLVGYVIYSGFCTTLKTPSGSKSPAKLNLTGFFRKTFLLWFIPVIAIPSLWPVLSFMDNQFNQWVSDVQLQSTRPTGSLVTIFHSFATVDPILLILGLSGMVYAALKRDYFIILWVLLFISFYALFYTQYFHIIPLIPVWCIASSLIIDRAYVTIKNFSKRYIVHSIFFVSISFLIVIGLVSTLLIVTTDLTSGQFEAAMGAYTYVTTNADKKYNTTIIASPAYTWMYAYILGTPNVMDYLSAKFYPIATQNIILISDPHYLEDLRTGTMSTSLTQLATKIRGGFQGNVLNYDTGHYPFGSMIFNYDGSNITLFTN